MNQTISQKAMLQSIKFAKKLFYNTPVHRSKVFNYIYKKIFKAAFKPGELIEVDYQGQRINIPSHDITILPSLLNGEYEKDLIEIFKDSCKKGGLFIDVGANIGLFSLVAAEKIGSKGKVYAFEPEPNNILTLNGNIQKNGYDNIVVIPKAISSSTGKMRLYLENASIGTHTLEAGANPDHNGVDVEVTTLDHEFKEVKYIDVIKIDVEGHELSVLQGGNKTLKKCKTLFFEYTRNANKVLTEEWAKTLSSFDTFYLIDEKSSKTVKVELEDLLKEKYANVMAVKS